jgi:hypothetical protein
MNKIFSMSVFGNDLRYYIGAKKQADLAKKLYSDWEIRIYTENPALLIDLDPTVKIIVVSENTWGPFWRFEPLFENKDNITIVRDSDDRITFREIAAVQEWLNSDKSFHIIKDHEAHFEFPIMAGLFGFKGKLDNDLYEQMKISKIEAQYYLSDQIFLRDFVYPKIKDKILMHSLDTGWFGESRKNLINKYCFCGNGYDHNDIPIYPETKNSKIDFTQNIVFDGGKLTG